jgi:prephenate dehydrogenase
VKVAIVGMGLIGGSLARDLSAKGHHVLGADRSKSALTRARRAGALAQVLGPDLKGIEDADLCVIALPVDATAKALLKHRARLTKVRAVTDVGSTKLTIMRAAAKAGLAKNFVGSHPMAGGHDSGWTASKAGLFRGQRVYICSPKSVTPSSLRMVNRLWRVVGGRRESIDAARHDDLLAGTSHLPQVVALALTMLYADERIARGTLGRGGREMTRLAASNGEMWGAILADNHRNVAMRVARLRKALEQLQAAITRRDADAIRRLMSLTNRWARS